MPIHVMVDLFLSITFYRTPAFFVFHNISDACFTSLMDDGWDVKYNVAANVIKSVVSKQSVIFKYHIGRSILYVTFEYNRLRLQHGMELEEVDQTQSFSTISVECEVPHEEKKLVLEVGSSWTLTNIRNELSMHLATEFIHNFSFHIIEDGIILEKV